MTKPTFVDLFSGCGGFGLGAVLAGFECKLAIDIDRDLQSSYALNFPNSNVLNADVNEIFSSNWAYEKAKGVDLVIGGPPCQGFGTIGRQNRNDPRNLLISTFLKL